MKFELSGKLEIIGILIAVLIALIPMFWMVSSSLKPSEEIFQTPPSLFPGNLTLSHYKDLFSTFHFGRLALNSMLIASGTVILSIALGVLGAYGFSRYSFPGSNVLLYSILLVRVLVPAALVVPLYRMMLALGLLDTWISVIIGVTLLNLPFVVWLLKVFFDGLPREIEEASKIDGRSTLRTLWEIVLPIAKPAILTAAFFSLIYGWTDLLFGISFTQTTGAQPLTVGLAMMQTGQKIYWGGLMAGGTFVAVPILILGLLLQKYLVKGLTLSH